MGAGLASWWRAVLRIVLVVLFCACFGWAVCAAAGTEAKQLPRVGNNELWTKDSSQRSPWEMLEGLVGEPWTRTVLAMAGKQHALLCRQAACGDRGPKAVCLPFLPCRPLRCRVQWSLALAVGRTRARSVAGALISAHRHCARQQLHEFFACRTACVHVSLSPYHLQAAAPCAQQLLCRVHVSAASCTAL